MIPMLVSAILSIAVVYVYNRWFLFPLFSDDDKATPKMGGDKCYGCNGKARIH